MRRSDANAAALGKIVADRTWLGHLAADEATRSKTSVCLTVEGADEAFIKKFAALLDAEGAAYDIAGYRDAPPGLRIWCGATVDTADIEALGPWLDWAYQRRLKAHKNHRHPEALIRPSVKAFQGPSILSRIRPMLHDRC